MKPLAQKFAVQIEVDLNNPEFDVKVINLGTRKGFIDVEGLREKLVDVFKYMQNQGMQELTSQIEREQLH